MTGFWQGQVSSSSSLPRATKQLNNNFENDKKKTNGLLPAKLLALFC